jgi:hypothetical protein
MNLEAREIYKKGLEKDADHNILLDELIKKDKYGEYIYYAGSNWPSFNYKKGLNELIKKNETGVYIYHAGKYWPFFNHEKGLDALKNTKYYDEALKKWPKGIKDTKKITQELRNKSKKLPSKKLKLESSLFKLREELGAIVSTNMSAVTANSKAYKKSKKKFKKNVLALDFEEILKKRKIEESKIEKFSTKEEFNEWLKKADIFSIYKKGLENIPGFDYNKAFEKLLRKDKGTDFYAATKAFLYWIPFLNREKYRNKFFEKLYATDNIGLTGLFALHKIPGFDRKRALEAMFDNIKNSPSPEREAENLLFPIKSWNITVPEYKKIIDFLSDLPNIVNHGRIEDLIAKFPKGKEESKIEIERLKKTSKKLPSKKLKLR